MLEFGPGSEPGPLTSDVQAGDSEGHTLCRSDLFLCCDGVFAVVLLCHCFNVLDSGLSRQKATILTHLFSLQQRNHHSPALTEQSLLQ